ncbi:uncharacterized protein LOC128201885 [Galleria mellonella]|uniref:Uncharacterized protein LOC128201885 n=1 Tax=Galleria mellonella TaxID=7137 RepID=A0ABM3MXU1_GALME|nr:uncharacterized protein LOC128201885 [Galleria mellonella]
MYRILLAVTILLTTVQVYADEDKEKCTEVLSPGTFRCCKKASYNGGVTISIETLQQDESLKECFQQPGRPESCAREICIGNKKGFVTIDGKIDKAMLKMNIERDFKEQPVYGDILQNCVNGDVSKYGSDDMCDIMKLRQCFDLQFLKNCNEWDDEAPCTGTKDLIEKCSKLYS